MKYLIYVSMTYVAKNKLQKEIQTFFEPFNQTLHDDLKDLKNIIKDEVQKINENNPRCKPAKVLFMDRYGKDKHLICSGIDSLSFTILFCQNFKK